MSSGPAGRSAAAAGNRPGPGLRRELGALQSYAALLGILVGAGIFRVTAEAAQATGPGVLLGHLLLTPLVLATAVPYLAFASTPLGREPGGEYAHLRAVFRSDAVGFLAGWLKIVAYLGAGAYLGGACADYGIELAQQFGLPLEPARWRLPFALGALSFFALVHAAGVRWYGRVQVAMCAVLGVAIAVLVVPGLFAIEPARLQPLLPNGVSGLARSLPPLLFAYAGFESLAQTAGETRDPASLPRVFVRGILGTALIFMAMTAVAFGVLSNARIQESSAPMSEAAAQYLPFGATALVTVGAIFAITTSINATLFVPARLAWIMARDGLLPGPLAAVHAGSGVPRVAVAASWAGMVLLLWSGQVALALGIAVAGLMLLYLAHGLALLLLPRLVPDLYARAAATVPRRLQVAAGVISVLGMAAILAVQFRADAARIAGAAFWDRAGDGELTSLELLLAWSAVGAVLYAVRPSRSTAR
ncbi:MAG TPA: APC family permease [Planctomycetota bacterium]